MFGALGLVGGPQSGISAVDIRRFGIVNSLVLDQTTAVVNAIASAAQSGDIISVPANYNILIADAVVTTDLNIVGPGRFLYPSGHWGMQFDPAWGAETVVDLVTTDQVGAVIQPIRANLGPQVVGKLTFSGAAAAYVAANIRIGDIIKLYCQKRMKGLFWQAQLFRVIEYAADGNAVLLDRLPTQFTGAWATPVFRKLPTKKLYVNNLGFAANGDIYDETILRTGNYAAFQSGASVNAMVDVRIDSAWEEGYQAVNAWGGIHQVRATQLVNFPGNPTSCFGYALNLQSCCYGPTCLVFADMSRHAFTTACASIGISVYSASAYKSYGFLERPKISGTLISTVAGWDTHEGVVQAEFRNCSSYGQVQSYQTAEASFGVGFGDRGFQTVYLNCRVVEGGINGWVCRQTIDYSDLEEFYGFNTTTLENCSVDGLDPLYAPCTAMSVDVSRPNFTIIISGTFQISRTKRGVTWIQTSGDMRGDTIRMLNVNEPFRVPGPSLIHLDRLDMGWTATGFDGRSYIYAGGTITINRLRTWGLDAPLYIFSQASTSGTQTLLSIGEWEKDTVAGALESPVGSTIGFQYKIAGCKRIVGLGDPATKIVGTLTPGATFSRIDGGVGTSQYVYDGTSWVAV